MKLRYSDLKGRTDLVGKRIKLNGERFLLTDLWSSSFDAVAADGFRANNSYSESRFLELLDEEESEINEILTRRERFLDTLGKMDQDQRTEITWENVQLEDTVENKTTGRRYSIRELLKNEIIHRFEILQPKRTLTRQQAEEKLKEFGCEVTISE